MNLILILMQGSNRLWIYYSNILLRLTIQLLKNQIQMQIQQLYELTPEEIQIIENT
jgi:hypothetical protein